MARWSRHKRHLEEPVREWRPVHPPPPQEAEDPPSRARPERDDDSQTGQPMASTSAAGAAATSTSASASKSTAVDAAAAAAAGSLHPAANQSSPPASARPIPSASASAGAGQGQGKFRPPNLRWGATTRANLKTDPVEDFPSLLSTDCRPQAINLEGADILLFPGFLKSSSASQFYEDLAALPSWQKRPIQVRDRDTGRRFEALEGRPTISFSDPPGRVYSYSGSSRVAEAFSAVVLRAKMLVERALKDLLEEWGSSAGRPPQFNYCLANLYENGWQSVGKHADDEPDILPRSPIATLSFGASRTFLVEAKGNPDSSVKIPLHSGDLLLMRGRTQERFVHSIPKEKRVTEPRISLTFRVNR